MAGASDCSDWKFGRRNGLAVMEKPKIWILAGPNGAGKTTFARENFPELIKTTSFLNADDIAQGLSPQNQGRAAMQAGRIALTRRKELIEQRSSFAIETTLASKTLLRTLTQLPGSEYSLLLIYLYISSPSLCIQRIAQRVALGGHHIPVDVVLRRYESSLRLLQEYLRLSDSAVIYLADGTPKAVLRKDRRGTRISDRKIWKRIAALSG